VHDLAHVTGLAWGQAGDAIWLLGVPLDENGDDRLGLGGSSYLEVVHGQLTGRPPLTDLALEGQVQGFLRAAIAAGLVRSAHDLSDGGLAVALAEACIASGLGAAVDLPAGGGRPDRLLFAEGGARVLVSVAPEQEAAWGTALAEAGEAVPAERVGTVTADSRLVVARGGEPLLALAVEQLRHTYEQAIPARLGKAGPPPDR
jgi:phosphoribosylformylglycinamidine synthase